MRVGSPPLFPSKVMVKPIALDLHEMKALAPECNGDSFGAVSDALFFL